MKLLDGGRTCVPHRRAQATNQLVGNGIDGTAERHSSLNALRHKLFLALHIRLEVTVLGEGALLAGQPAPLHRAQRTHAAVHFVLLAIYDDRLSRSLCRTCQQ